jgi:disulfide bond formation protein DsbB
MNAEREWYSYFFLWVMAFIATLGSLFFSEVMEYPPCVLCWYQRICMYPLVLIFLVKLLFGKKDTLFYSTPLALIGWGIALYHNLLYYKILPEHASPCRQGISCTSVHIEWFGFVTIPLLSFIAFSVILISSYIIFKRTHQNEK